MKWLRHFDARGVFWRQFLRWGIRNVPMWLEPIAIAWWSFFFLLWGPGRRGVMMNLRAIVPGSTPLGNLTRTFRVMRNFAWTIADNGRFAEERVIPDWEFVGAEHFDALQSHPGGAIILTAHMGSYDLGAQLFAETSTRKIFMVRAPEIDPHTRAFEEGQLRTPEGLKIDFNTKASDLAFDLLNAVQNGELVAIQGDRVTPGIASLPGTLFGKRTEIPAGPFALAMAARAPIFPLFIIRLGRRHYRLLTLPPIHVNRRSRSRDEDLGRAVNEWCAHLESVVRGAWWQWYAFDAFYKERAA